ncbi:MAG: GNAT family N-acetyltransferase [Sediminibacterium sp.]
MAETQGKGVGKMIFAYMAEIAKAYLCDTIRLKVFHKNEQAISFYIKNGFSMIGVETTDIGNGYLIIDHVMTKQLTH